MSDPIRLVLLRPRNAENLGAAARAMKNFGLADWVWVNPGAEDLGPAQRLAVHAADLLATVQLANTLDEAVADCVWVVGTSSRKVEGKRRLSPRDAARELVERSGQGPVALVFGDERNGLSNAEILRCHDLSAAPTLPDQPSINLAQAVLLYSYEIRMSQLAATSPSTGLLPTPATDADLVQLEAALRDALKRGRFLLDDGRQALPHLLAPLVRARLSHREVRLWLAALHTLVRRLGSSG